MSAFQVYVDVPGGLNLSVSLPLVIGTIPLHTCATRTSSISSNCSTLSWLGLQERPEGLYSKLTHMFCFSWSHSVRGSHGDLVFFFFKLQHLRATVIWQYQRLKGTTVCSAVIGLMMTEMSRDLC